ncbi:hypothetical protein Pcinc_018537 [Petrolisthes cinctipes]|uniref:Uncharacterized protein n=1 Tax=Petrolisthes cinctipes TaxID=88211 RepID=A0AAE1FLZ2_PETCI|nr:hypothetical protein Pcinc_018537 [Petrolisthes cinctipes]
MFLVPPAPPEPNGRCNMSVETTVTHHSHLGSDNPPEVSTSAGGGQTVGLHPWSPPRYQGPARKGSFSHADALKEPLPREQV